MITVGRHTADDGAGVHPLVAAALQQRPTPGEPDQPRHLHEAPRAADERQGGLGWPGEPGDGTGLGWPADDAVRATDAAPDTWPERPARRRGWRRLFGGGAAADRSRDSSAA